MNRSLPDLVGPGFWAWAGAILLCVLTLAVMGLEGAPGLARAGFAFAGFYVLVGLGQMLVITAGPGNIDLSIPSVMTLAGYLAMGQMQGDDAGLVPGLALGACVGLAAGLGNAALIVLARIPPMIATLASGFVVQSAAIAYSRGSTASPAETLMAFSIGLFAGIPSIAWVALAVSAAFGLVLRYGAFGRRIEALGQNLRAARFSAVPVASTLAAVYALTGLLAGATGILFAAYSGGASLGMAQDFLLISIAVVVVGGTNVAGGRASVSGLIGAAAFLYLIVTLLNVLQLSAGLKSILTGAIIVAVLALSNKPALR